MKLVKPQKNSASVQQYKIRQINKTSLNTTEISQTTQFLEHSIKVNPN